MCMADCLARALSDALLLSMCSVDIQGLPLLPSTRSSSAFHINFFKKRIPSLVYCNALIVLNII